MKKICEVMGKVFLIGGLLSFLGLWINLKPVGLGFLYGLIALVSGIIFSIIFCALYEILESIECIANSCQKNNISSEKILETVTEDISKNLNSSTKEYAKDYSSIEEQIKHN